MTELQEEEQPEKWVDLNLKEIRKCLGGDLSTVALTPENRYLLFTYAPLTIEHMFKDASPYSFQQYLALACWEGLKSIITGNNPIGALIVVREDGMEYIFADHNRARTSGSKRYHAEQGAIDAWEELDFSRLLWKRKAPDSQNKGILVTTREPCSAMCTGRILSTRGIGMVMIGTQDVDGGGMCNGREKTLTPVFRRKWEESGLEVMLTDYVNADAPNYVNSEFEHFLEETFRKDRFQTKEPIPDRPPLSKTFGGLPNNYTSKTMLPHILDIINQQK